jgi:hypothetical protein
VVLCRLGGSRAGKALAFSRPSRTDARCRCLSVWSFSGWASFYELSWHKFELIGLLKFSWGFLYVLFVWSLLEYFN